MENKVEGLSKERKRQNYAPLIGISLFTISFIAAIIPFFPATPFQVKKLSKQLPFQGTTTRKMESIVNLIEKSGRSKTRKEFMDIGCGDGRVLLHLARNQKIRFQKYRGVELNSTLCIISKLRSLHLSSVSIEKKNFFDLNKGQLRHVDTIFVFGIPALMEQFRDKFEADLLPGSLVLTNKFGLPGREPLLRDGEISLYIIHDRSINSRPLEY